MADEPREELVTPDTSGPHSNEVKERAAQALPSISTEAHVPPSVKNTRTSERKKKCWLEWGKFAIEAITLVVIAIYTCVAYRQWDEMRIATSNSERSFRLDERAWVGVTEVQTPTELHEGTSLNSTIFLINSGKTPAFNVVQRAGYRIRKAGDEFDPAREVSLATPFRQGIILPNGKRLLGISDLGNIGGQRAIELNSGEYRLYLFGEITYDDAFQHSHRTRFSMRMELGKTLAFAPFGSYDYAD